jgi:hypothetical protein
MGMRTVGVLVSMKGVFRFLFSSQAVSNACDLTILRELFDKYITEI